MIPIPLSQPDITELEIDAVVSVLRSSRLSLGPRMEEFEGLVGDYAGVSHALAVSSGTAGLHLCLIGLGIGEGDEVIVPSFTFVAAANVIRYVGATPVFVDIEATTLNMDPCAIEAAVTPRTRAIIVVHTFGVPAAMDVLLEIARQHRLLVIEDACEAIGAEIGARRVGSFGDAAVFAFYPNKQITTGEGGMVVTRDASLAREIKALRNQGRYDSDEWHQHSLLGYNYRLSEMNAALGCAQMRRLEAILERRESVAQRYSQMLGDEPTLVLPPRSIAGGRISWFVYVVRLSASLTRSQRDETVREMGRRGVQCGRYFAPIHTQPAYAGVAVGQPLPVTEQESERTVALPFFAGLTEVQMAYVSRALRETLRWVASAG